MRQIYQRCAGLDVHRDQVSACARVPGPGGERAERKAEFSTTTSGLLELLDWLMALGVTNVAMEATGVFWRPVFYVLEAHMEVIVVNAAHMRNVPGRKTDTGDAAWIAQLLEHGLLKPSFIPPEPIRELRELTRYRKTQIQERQREANRLHKVLQDAGIKLSSVASDALGASGRAMVEALIEGTTDPEVLADLAKGRLRSKTPALREALEGRFKPVHALLCRQILDHLDFLDAAIESLSVAIEERLVPFEVEAGRLITIPGVAKRTCEVILSEIGVDMGRFPTAGHLASWAGICPGNNESAGKRKTGKTTKGSTYLRTALIEAANAAARSKGTYLSAHYQRVKRNRGHQKAIVALAHTILVIVWHLLSKGVEYRDLGADFFVQRDADSARQRAIRQLERLGHKVILEPVA